MLYTANVVELDLRVLNAVHPGLASMQILTILNACEIWPSRGSSSEYSVEDLEKILAALTVLSRNWLACIGVE